MKIHGALLVVPMEGIYNNWFNLPESHMPSGPKRSDGLHLTHPLKKLIRF